MAMFDSLSERLGGVFDKLRGRGALNESEVRAAMREVRIALLEADVALHVVRDFIENITEKAVGQNVLKSVNPGQQVVKIVNDGLTEIGRAACRESMCYFGELPGVGVYFEKKKKTRGPRD